MVFRILTAFYLILSIQSAHALWGSDYPQEPVSVYELGKQQLEAGKLEKAIKTFEHFIENHSNNELLAKVKVSLADAFFAKEKYQEALKLYERSHLENPYTEDGAHTLFRMGECNLKFISKHKGQKYIPYAIAAFVRFTNLYPESELVSKAQENIRVVKKIEAEYQIEVGNYYFRHKDYCAAFNHFEKVLHLEEFGTFKTVDTYIAQCQQNDSCLDEIASCEFDLTEVNARMK